VQCRSGHETKGPLKCEHKESEDKIDSLQHGNRFDGSIEGLGEEIPEDLRPEEAFNSSSNLIYSFYVSHYLNRTITQRSQLTGCRGQDDETSPVVLDKLAHFDGSVGSSSVML
jgi:hypothetical protein